MIEAHGHHPWKIAGLTPSAERTSFEMNMGVRFAPLE
jgi:hypothetical protein